MPYWGRWWRVTLLASAIGWPVLLVATGAVRPRAGLGRRRGLAVVNTGADVLLHQGIRHGGGKLRRALAARRSK